MLQEKTQQERMRLRLRRWKDVLYISIPENRGGDRIQVGELALDKRSDSSLIGTRKK